MLIQHTKYIPRNRVKFIQVLQHYQQKTQHGVDTRIWSQQRKNMSLFKDFENNYDSKNIAIRTPNYTLRQASSRLLMQWTPIDCYRSASIYKLLLQLMINSNELMQLLLKLRFLRVEDSFQLLTQLTQSRLRRDLVYSTTFLKQYLKACLFKFESFK